MTRMDRDGWQELVDQLRGAEDRFGRITPGSAEEARRVAGELLGFPMVVADAWPKIGDAALGVLQSAGGQGAVREFCDVIWHSRNNHGRARHAFN